MFSRLGFYKSEKHCKVLTCSQRYFPSDIYVSNKNGITDLVIKCIGIFEGLTSQWLTPTGRWYYILILGISFISLKSLTPLTKSVYWPMKCFDIAVMGPWVDWKLILCLNFLDVVSIQNQWQPKYNLIQHWAWELTGIQLWPLQFSGSAKTVQDSRKSEYCNYALLLCGPVDRDEDAIHVAGFKTFFRDEIDSSQHLNTIQQA